jgi:hypothetical protein
MPLASSWRTETAVATSAPAHPRPPAAVANPQVVLDWNATPAATLLARGKPQPESMVYIGLTQAAVSWQA